MNNWKPFKEAEPINAEDLKEMLELAKIENELEQIDEIPVPKYVYERILELINQQAQPQPEAEADKEGEK